MVKKARSMLIGLMAAIFCFTLAAVFVSWKTAANAETEPVEIVTLSDEDDFKIDSAGKCTGLSERGATKIADGQYYELIFPARVTSVFTGDFCGTENIYSEVVAPNDKLVKVSFAEGSQCSSMKKTRQGDLFVHCTALKEVDFTNAENLNVIERRTFYGCTSLENVIFANALKDDAKMSIKGNAFGNTALTSFEIPVYVTSIASNALIECTKLTTMTVAEGNAKYTYYTKENGDRYDQAVYEKDADGKIVALAVAPSSMTGITLPKAVLDVNYVPEEGEDEATTAVNIAAAVYDKAVALDGVVSDIIGLETVAIEENDELYAYGNCLCVKEGSKLTNKALETLDYYPVLANDLLIVPCAVKEITLPAGFTYIPSDKVSYEQEAYFWYYYLDSMDPSSNGHVPMRQLKVINTDAGNTAYRSVDGTLFPKDSLSKFWIPYAATSFTVPAGMTDELSVLAEKLAGNKLLRQIKVEEGNAEYTAVDGSLFKKDYSDYYIPNGATSFTVPAQMTSLNFTVLIEKLSANKNLQEVNVEGGNAEYVSYDGMLFAKNSPEAWIPYTATSVTIPKEVTQFDGSALVNHPYLTSVNVEAGSPYFVSENEIVYDKGKTKLIYASSAVTEFYVPATLEYVAEDAFAVYENNKRVANRVKKVYVEDVAAWSRIRFGERIETAEQYEEDPTGRLSMERRQAVVTGLKNGYGANPMSCGAEMYVRNNGEWTLLENLVLDFEGEIGDLAFAGCKSLRTVTIGNKVTRIGEMAFAMCKNIRSISVPFVGCTREYTEVNEKYVFYSTYAWEVFGGRTEGNAKSEFTPDTIDTYTVTGCNILEKTIHKEGSIDLDKHTNYPINIIPRYAFSDLPVRKIVISIDEPVKGGVTLGAHALMRSTVSEIDLENSQITVSKGALIAHQNNSSSVASFIKSITVPKTLKNINSLFFWIENVNSSLEKVIIPEGVEYLEWNQFGDIDALTLPSTIGGFDSLEGVKTVYLTGFTPRAGQTINIYLARTTGIYVAIDSEVYAALPDAVKGDDDDQDYAPNKIFYQADVVFRLKDSAGNVLAETTEKHLAAKGAHSESYLKWNQTRGASGDVYWALNESYALPYMVGHYKADSAKWMLDGVAVTPDTRLRGDKAQYVIEQTLESTDIQLTPKNAEKTYDGNVWTVPAGMEVTKVSAMKGGNNYTYGWSNKTMPVDAGTYSVTAKCTAGYSWYDSASVTGAERTFTLIITPVSVDIRWFYSPDGAAGQDVTGTIPERAYDGRSVHSGFYAEFTDVSGQTKRVDYTDLSLYVSGDHTMPVYSLADVGTYDIMVGNSGKTADGAVWLGNYVHEGSLQFAVTPHVIDLNDYANLSWSLEEYRSSLRDGTVYIYRGVPYAYEQPTLGTPDTVLHVLDSIVRLRKNDEHKIVIGNIPALLSGSGTQYTAVYSGNTAAAVGRYTAISTLTVANPNYVFGYGLNGDLKSRGMTITLNSDGTAIIQKVWYVVTIDNGMLKADGSEYVITGWTFGEDVVIAAPRLEHGDEDASNYLDNGNVHFTLLRNGETVVSNFTRASFNEIVNKSMPSGRYELKCTVSDVTVGSHTHWWNDEPHGDADSNVLYHGFERTLAFEVAAANMTFSLAALEEGGFADYEWELNSEKEGFFATFAALANAANKIGLVTVVPQGYWAEHKDCYGNYSLSYNFARMNNNMYLPATDGNIQKYIAGGARGTYTVYFQVTAPNHNPLTDLGDGRYAYFFTVTVWESVDPVDIHVENVTYTGLKNIPALPETDIYHVVLDDTDEYIDGGEHTLTLVLNDSDHYRWKGVGAGESGLAVKYTINKALNEFIEAPDIVRWIEGKFDERENGFIGAAKFGTISYVITDTEDNVIYDLSKNIDKRAEMEAGTYILKATVEGNDNYNGLSEAFTIRILEKVGLPWWAVLLIVIGALGVAALIIFILWKKGVFQIITEKIVVAIRTKASVDATIASVRAAKRMEEGKQSVAEAKRRERIEELRKKAAEQRALPPEERAAALDAKAQAEAEKAEKILARSEAMKRRAGRLRANTEAPDNADEVEELETENVETTATEQPSDD